MSIHLKPSFLATLPDDTIIDLSENEQLKFEDILDLPEEHLQFINNLFEKWALDDKICLNELWALDTFEKLLELQKIIQSENSKQIFEKLLSYHATLFVLGGVYIIAQGAYPNREDLMQSSPWLIGSDQMQKFAAKALICLNQILSKEQSRLQTFKTTISPKAKQKLLEARMPEYRIIQAQIETLKKSMLFIQYLWGHPLYNVLLSEEVISRFRNSNKIIKDDVKINQQHLEKYLKLLSDTTKTAYKTGGLGVEVPFFDNCFNRMRKLESINEDKVRDFSSDLFKTMVKCMEEFSKAYERTDQAVQGTLTHAEYCKSLNLFKAYEKSHLHFCQQLLAASAYLNWVNMYLGDIQRIFDDRIASFVIQDHTDYNTYFERVENSLHKIFKTPVESPEGKFSKTCKTFQRFFEPHLPSKEKIDLVFKMMKFVKYHRAYFPFWRQVLQPFQNSIAALSERVIPALKKAHQYHLQKIDKENISDQFIQEYRKECIEQMYPLCLLIMLLRDIQLFLSCYEEKPQKLHDDMHMIPEELVDFIELKGLEERVEAILKEKIQLKTIEEEFHVESISTQQLEKVSLPQFIIAPGEKVRRLCKRLAELGFTSKGEMTGSHLKLTHQSKGGHVVVPMHRDLKPGTAKAVQNQINQILQE